MRRLPRSYQELGLAEEAEAVGELAFVLGLGQRSDEGPSRSRTRGVAGLDGSSA
jgi:hypothetical protein